jgi:hypothetical protein
MRRYLWIGVCCLLIAAYGATLLGCMTTNQLAAERAYYEAKVAMTKQAASQPIFEMVAGDSGQPIILPPGAALRVFQVPASSGNDGFNQYVQRDYVSPWLNLIGTTVAVAAPWVGAWGIVSAMGNVIPKTGNVSTNISDSSSRFSDSSTHSATNVKTSGTGNRTQITGDGSPATITDSTGVPTIVTQPAPVIVPAPDPVIITQPPPVIITQPPPVIVLPSYPPATTP